MVGRWLGGLGLLARVEAPLRTRTVARPGPPAALDVGGDPVADHRHPLGVADPLAGQLEEVALGLAADLGLAPEAVSTAARIEPVPGQAPPGIGRVGSRLVANSAAPPLQRQGRGQQLLVVEAAVAGDDHRRRPRAPASPSSSSQPGGGDRLLEGRGADHEGAGAAPGAARRPARAVDHPGGDDLLLGSPAPRRRAAARRRSGGGLPGLLVTKTTGLPPSISSASASAEPGTGSRPIQTTPSRSTRRPSNSIRQRHRGAGYLAFRGEGRPASDRGRRIVARDALPAAWRRRAAAALAAAADRSEPQLEFRSRPGTQRRSRSARQQSRDQVDGHRPRQRRRRWTATRWHRERLLRVAGAGLRRRDQGRISGARSGSTRLRAERRAGQLRVRAGDCRGESRTIGSRRLRRHASSSRARTASSRSRPQRVRGTVVERRAGSTAICRAARTGTPSREPKEATPELVRHARLDGGAPRFRRSRPAIRGRRTGGSLRLTVTSRPSRSKSRGRISIDPHSLFAGRPRAFAFDSGADLGDGRAARRRSTAAAAFSADPRSDRSPGAGRCASPSSAGTRASPARHRARSLRRTSEPRASDRASSSRL